MSDPPPTSSSDEDPSLLHQQTETAMAAIAAETAKQPLTSMRVPTSDLETQYTDNAKFAAGLSALQKGYSHMRMVRGDGNCYYRAFLYSLVESLLSNPTKAASFLNFFKTTSWNRVLQQGYDEMALEIFHDEVVDLMERLVDGKLSTLDDFHQEMNQENATSDYCTWYLRVVTATHLKQDPDRFLPFLLDAQSASGGQHLDMNQFCARHIEPMGQECEQIQVLALAEAVGVRVKIEYLDGRQDGITSHEFGPDTASVGMTLLYRPGHYDVLYKQ